MYYQVKKWVAFILTIAVSILTLMSILSIWGYLDKDITGKSISTLGILTFASAVVLLIFKVIEDKKDH